MRDIVGRDRATERDEWKRYRERIIVGRDREMYSGER